MLQYSCFVEGCERKCATHQKRRLHLIDKHMYPRNFFFAVTRDGIDGRRSLLQEPGHHRRQSSASSAAAGPSSVGHRRRQSAVDQDAGEAQTDASPTKMAVVGEAAEKSKEERGQRGTRDTDMDDLAGAMSALQFVPTSVRFGRGGGRAGFSKR